MRLAIIFALLAAPCYGQGVVQLEAGASNFIGNGGGAVLYGKNGETHLSAGVINGRFVYSASEEFAFHGWDVTAGDSQFTVTGGQFSLNTPIRGVSLVRKNIACKQVKKEGPIGYVGQRCHPDQLSIFVGAVGELYSSPYFFGINRTHLGAGFGYKRELTRHISVGTIQAIAGSKRTSLEEAGYKTNHFELHGQAGWLENNPEISGSASASWNHFGVNAGRSTYIFNVQPVGPALPASQVTVNNLGVYAGWSRFSGSASFFQSNLNTGQSYSVGTRFSFLQIQAGDYVSGRVSSKLLTFTEHTLHWSLSQYLTRSNGTTNFNFGGGYQSNRFNVQAGYSVLYFPALRQPFQKVLSISVGFRFRSASFSTGTVVQPNGKNQWAVSGDDYLQTKLTMPSVGDGPAVRMLVQNGHGGKFTMQGLVVDERGEPVEGAAVTVSNDVVYTGTLGTFSIRQKKNTATVIVNPDSFMSGDWEVVTVPAVIRAGELVKIIVRRRDR